MIRVLFVLAITLLGSSTSYALDASNVASKKHGGDDRASKKQNQDKGPMRPVKPVPLKKTSAWEEYYQDTMNATEQRQTVWLAHKYFQMEGVNVGQAVDLGAGTGVDTLFLLKAGWEVFATDAEERSIEIILSRVDPVYLPHLKVASVPFSKMQLPKELDLINASRSLPFCHPSDFEKVWENIVNSLRVGGRFSGHFYGEHDYLASNPNATTLTHEAVLKLFKDRFKIEYIQIDDGLLQCSDKKMYPCHTYHVVAKKIR